MKFSNYTAEILVHEGEDKQDLKIKFLTDKRPNRVFIATQMIKSDIKKSEFQINDVDEKKCQYFHHSLKPTEIKKVINIDLKNAYATVLYNHGIISEKTFKYLITLPKIDRLASVGMLAYKKHIFNFEKGELIDYTIDESDLKKYFYYCVNKTHEIMQQVSDMLGTDFLFSWVDGIYFTDINHKLISVVNFLKENKYNHTIETLTDYVCAENSKYYFIKFQKGKGEKIFKIPKHSSKFGTQFYEYINANILKDYQYEKEIQPETDNL